MTPITITPEIYRELAAKVVNNLDNNDVCDETFMWRTPGFDVDAYIKCQVLRERWNENDSPIVGCWFELAEVIAWTDGGEAETNFDENELREYIIAYKPSMPCKL